MNPEVQDICSQVLRDLPMGYTIMAHLYSGEGMVTMWNADGVQYIPNWDATVDSQLWECLVEALERAKQA